MSFVIIGTCIGNPGPLLAISRMRGIFGLAVTRSAWPLES